MGELHDLLVRKAAKWALRQQCTFALLEPYTDGRASEFPDVLAWRMTGYSILVECKASRADFLADKRKPARVATSRAWELGMGQERWYAVAPGVATPDELPDRWGLLMLTEQGRFRRLRDATRSDVIVPEIQRREFCVLLPALRKIHEGYGPPKWLRFEQSTAQTTEEP
jgi:hypothetical protein